MELRKKTGIGTGYKYGEDHHNAQITDHEIELIRQLREEGMRFVDLIEKFGISKGYLSKVLNHHVR